MRVLVRIFLVISLLHTCIINAEELKNIPVQTDMVDIEADRLDVDTVKGEALFRGNVKAVKGDILLTSKELTLFFDNSSKKLKRLSGQGNVFIHWQDKEATCREVDYRLDKNLMILSGDVLITRGEEKLSGEKIVVDTATNRQEAVGRIKLRVNTEQESGILKWED